MPVKLTNNELEDQQLKIESTEPTVEKPQLVVLSIHGVPISGSNLKFNRKTGHAYRPKEHSQHVFTVSEYTREELTRKGITQFPVFPNGTPIAIDIQLFFPYRTQDYRTGKHAGELKPNAPKYMLSNKDIDNLLKPLKDGMQGILYANDKQIVKYANVEKMYDFEPRTEIKAWEIPIN